METEELHIRTKAIIEVVGKPKEHIEKKIKEYVEKIKEDNNLMVLNEKVTGAQEQGNIWSTFAEIELIIKGVANLVGFCIDYMPSSIEIIKPESFSFEERIFTNFVNDILGKLHRVDMVAKQLGTENTFLKKNMNSLIKNNILLLTRLGINKLDALSKAIMIEEKELKKFVDTLIEEKRIKEEAGVYSIV